MAEFSRETKFAVGTFSNIDEPVSQDAVLHQIFTRILHNRLPQRHIKIFEEVLMTLYRLYVDQEWGPARTFFYMLTGTLINPERPVLSIDLNSYFKLSCSMFVHLDPRTINGECDKSCQSLNVLWFDSIAYNDESGDEDDDDSEAASSEYSSCETLSSRSNDHIDNPLSRDYNHKHAGRSRHRRHHSHSRRRHTRGSDAAHETPEREN